MLAVPLGHTPSPGSRQLDSPRYWLPTTWAQYIQTGPSTAVVHALLNAGASFHTHITGPYQRPYSLPEVYQGDSRLEFLVGTGVHVQLTLSAAPSPREPLH